MKTKLRFTNFEKGQVLPIVVIGILVIIMMAALMIDGGMLLSHRRTAQAAADAGALGGAKSLCPNVADQGQAYIDAEKYVGLNKADVVSITFPQSNIIRVETSVTSQSFFARIFDQFGLTAAAAAEANCTALSGASVLPVGFPCIPESYLQTDEEGEGGEGGEEGGVDYGALSDTSECYIRFGDPTKDIDWHIANNRMVIIMDTEEVQENYCYPDGPINCDLTDEELMSVLIGSENRGWLSLDGSGGANELCGWVYPGYDGWIGQGYWLSGQEGDRSKLWQDPKCLDMIIGKAVQVPVFNQWCRGHDPEFDCPAKWEIGDNKSLVKGGLNLDYRIEGFASFVLTCADGPGGGQAKKCPYRQHLIDTGVLYNRQQDSSIKSIEGYFYRADVSDGTGYGTNLGTFVVQLTK